MVLHFLEAMINVVVMMVCVHSGGWPDREQRIFIEQFGLVGLITCTVPHSTR